MATTKTDAQKVQEYRKQAQDKTLPQEVRDMADKKANAIEGKSVEKATGMKLAKGGMPMRGERTATNKAKKMAVGGSLEQMQQAMTALKQPQMQQAQQASPSQKPKGAVFAPVVQQKIANKKAIMARVAPKAEKMMPSMGAVNAANAVNAKNAAMPNKQMMAKGGVAKKAKK